MTVPGDIVDRHGRRGREPSCFEPSEHLLIEQGHVVGDRGAGLRLGTQ